MSLHSSPPARRASTRRLIALLLVAASTGLTALALRPTPADSAAPAVKGARAEAARKTEPAKNPTRLLLHDDGRQVVGWVSGPADLSGQAVQITVAGEKKKRKVKLDGSNAFAWPYKAAAPTKVEFTASVPGPDQKAVALRDSLTLAPAPSEDTPSVFFVVDRTAYRPTQTLHFAGFLRKMNRAGDFEPVADHKVKIELVSEKKRTRVLELTAASDDFGRVTGSYTFRDDALDNYLLSVGGFKGSARVLLGEYRKSKIKLKIDGVVKEDKLELTFEVLDFLDKRVPGSRASFAAQVVRSDGMSKAARLKGEEFAYHVPLISSLNEWEALSEDETLLWQADGPASAAFLSSGGTAVVAQVAGEVDVEGKDVGRYSIDLEKEWLAGNHSVVVSGVVTDTNGREQRATATIAIGEAKCPGVSLALDRAEYQAGDKVTVRAVRTGKEAKEHAFEGPLTLVVMKLSPGTPAASGFRGYGYTYYEDYHGYAQNYRSSRYGGPRTWTATPQGETVKRTLVTAAAFGKDDTATVKITEPGAYKLVAIGQRDKGPTVRTEIGCVIRAAKGLPELTLDCDKDEFNTGDRLTGTITSRYAGARVLLTVRDSGGLRLWKPLVLGKNGTLRLNEELPAGLRYGCEVEVQYAGEDSRLAVASKYVRVLPADRMLTIKPTVKPTVAPGETVKIDLQVDRQEEVDLVVSVYDQSLLGIAADRSPDVKNFYLADERVRLQLRDVMRRRAGNVTLAALAKKAESILAADKKRAASPEGQSLQGLIDVVKHHSYLRAHDVVTALRLVGVEVLLHPGVRGYYSRYWYYQLDAQKKDHFLTDVLESNQSDWHLAFHVVNDSVVLHESHPSYAALPLARGSASASRGGYGGYSPYAHTLTRGAARGDAHWSVSGNAVHSAEGQAVLSHLPSGGAQSPELIDVDAGQSHIGVRRDFSDSAFWNARVRTDKTGKARVEFKLPDSLTNWQVVVTGVSKKMHVGQARTTFRSFKPIMVWPMLPRVFTEGDRVELFASVHNRTEEAHTIKVKLKAENGEVLSDAEKEVLVPPMSNVPVYWTFEALRPGFTQLLMTADCAAGNDASLKRLPVSRAAAEQFVTASGVVKDGATFEIPKGVDLKSASLEINFAPSLAADLADTLNYLVDYPYGCVEQTMSRFLPAIKVAQVLKDFRVEHPELQKKLPECVAGGIKRLLELQQPDGGWGWHGQSQTHEMMTPYALYGLLQAEKAGYVVPTQGAVDRGLDRLKTFIDVMKEDQTADRIYCIHVYAHRRDVDPVWWEFVEKQLKADKLSDYALALALETAVQKGKKELAASLADKLRLKVQKLQSHRFWETAGFSRWGDDKFEVTAAVMKALVAHDHKDALIDGILGFFAATKRGDRWNSTKDTAMILYAMCDYLAKERFDPKAGQAVSFSINDGKAQKVTFADKLSRKVAVPATVLKEGKNRLTFETATTGVMYRVVLRYWKAGSAIPPMDEGITVVRTFYLLDGKGGVTRQLKNGDTVPRGSYVLSEVVATNRLKTDMRYVLVENPKPACAEILPVDDARFVSNQGGTAYSLREERTAAVVFHHEQTGASLNDRCVLLAELAGDYVVPPASVEMMYRTELRGHSGTFALKVADEKK